MMMTSEEIVRHYTEAANKTKDIKVLADLNCTTQAEIRWVLVQAGVPGIKAPARQAPAKKKAPAAPKPDAVPSEIYDRIEAILAALPDEMPDTARQNAGNLIMGLFAAYLAARLGENVSGLDTSPRQSSERRTT